MHRFSSFAMIAALVSTTAACGGESAAGRAAGEISVDPRGGLVTPEIVFRFASTGDLSLAPKIQIFQRGSAVPGTVRVKRAASEAVFVPDQPMDSRYPFQWSIPAGLSEALFDTPDAVLGPCTLGDSDEDGIPDCKEQWGWWHAGQPLFAYGAIIGAKDVFIEIDHMDDPQRPWIAPRREALDAVARAFAVRGYTLHFDVGDLYGQPYLEGYNLGQHDPDGVAQGTLPYAASVQWIGPPDAAACANANVGGMNFIHHIRRPNFAPGRERSFYYVAFIAANTEGTGRAVAHVGGANIAISFGAPGLSANGGWDDVFGAYTDTPLVTQGGFVIDTPYTNQIINYQSGTLMHEFGHNLGLFEGGDDFIIAKPNYFSVMSYQYQVYGLPDLATYAGDRYHLYKSTACGPMEPGPKPAKEDLANGPLHPPSMFRIDYSDGQLGVLNESDLDETAGIAGIPIDWNCSGSSADQGVQRNINGGWGTALHDHDDWGAIKLYHRTHYLAATQQGVPWPNDGFKWTCNLPPPPP